MTELIESNCVKRKRKRVFDNRRLTQDVQSRGGQTTSDFLTADVASSTNYQTQTQGSSWVQQPEALQFKLPLTACQQAREPPQSTFAQNEQKKTKIFHKGSLTLREMNEHIHSSQRNVSTSPQQNPIQNTTQYLDAQMPPIKTRNSPAKRN